MVVWKGRLIVIIKAVTAQVKQRLANAFKNIDGGQDAAPLLLEKAKNAVLQKLDELLKTHLERSGEYKTFLQRLYMDIRLA